MKERGVKGADDDTTFQHHDDVEKLPLWFSAKSESGYKGVFWDKKKKHYYIQLKVATRTHWQAQKTSLLGKWTAQ